MVLCATAMSRIRAHAVRRRVAAVPAVSVVLAAFVRQAAGQMPCEAADHGMRADGSDNAAALTRTLTECAGRTIHMAAGTYTFRPQGFELGFTVPAGTAIVGDGSAGERQTV